MTDQHLHLLAQRSPASALKYYLDQQQAPSFVQHALQKLLTSAANPNPERAAVGQAIADLTAANALNADLDRRLGLAQVELAGLHERIRELQARLAAESK